MPASQQNAAATDRMIRILFRRGGIVAELKRIMLSRRMAFRSGQVRAEMRRRYPGVEVHTFQLHDTLDLLEFNQRLVCVCEDSEGKLYEVARGEQVRVVHHDVRGKIHKVTTVSVRNPKQLQLEI